MMKFLNGLMQRAFSCCTPHANGRGGRSASYRISAINGNLLIGSAYKTNGFEGGDEFEITLGRKHIRLKQLDETRDKLVAS